jgi:DNA-binding response OmpR family regulator
MTAKVLLVDDDPTILQLLKLFLENEGYQVWAAQNGSDGLEIASQVSPDLAPGNRGCYDAGNGRV